ncbi:DUF2147 domain-containing protein [Pedobacter xixiisoli]|uniref:DUF2147 domain-containing protein n=1 Tax=Pedobacter xixiisoli TaxID=1476464 RepID=A0A285ZPJ3_9SPHI|nr:DUF2147 domain-containing protein [Pedobacter xixiisoli]SOD11540.1 hypothetical protein SAMN06297358_0201 [Pedobacter xixiisoli]
MLKKASLFIVLFVLSVQVFAQKKDDILGKWLNPSGEGQIEIYKRGDKFFGKLAWIKEPNDANGKPKTDEKNPTESLRNRPVLGLEILKNFIFDDGKWIDGTIYDPKSGKTYSCKLTLKEANQLSVRGFIGVSLIGRTEVFKRVK